MSTYKPGICGSKTLNVRRYAPGSRVKGRWVDGAITTDTILANYQPSRESTIKLLPEVERTKICWTVYTSDVLRMSDEQAGRQADEVQIEGEWYKVVKVQTSSMGVLDHTKAIVVRITQ